MYGVHHDSRTLVISNTSRILNPRETEEERVEGESESESECGRGALTPPTSKTGGDNLAEEESRAALPAAARVRREGERAGEGSSESG